MAFVTRSHIIATHAKIFINDTLCLSIDTTDFIGFASYVGKSFWHIDLHFKGGVCIELEYDSKTKWEAILIELEKIKL